MNKIPEGNRIYFFSQAFNVEPALVSKSINNARNISILLETPLEKFKTNIKILVENKMPPMYVFHCLGVLYAPTSRLLKRIELCKEAGWFDIKASIFLSSEKRFQSQLKKILLEGGRESKSVTVFEYLSQRLGYDIEEVKQRAYSCDSYIAGGLTTNKVGRKLRS